MSNIFEHIDKDDLKILLYAGYINSPILLISNEETKESAKIVHDFLKETYLSKKIDIKVNSVDEFENYVIQQFILRNFSAYNFITKRFVFTILEEQFAKPFEDLLLNIENNSIDEQIKSVKDFNDSLIQFCDSIYNNDQIKKRKFQKYLQTEFPDKKEIITKELSKLISSEIDFSEFWYKEFKYLKGKMKRFKQYEKFWDSALQGPSEEVVLRNLLKLYSGKVFIDNNLENFDEIMDGLSDINQKVALKVIHLHQRINIKDLINELKRIGKEKNIELKLNELEEDIEIALNHQYIDEIDNRSD